jgi:hypothetical protein
MCEQTIKIFSTKNLPFLKFEASSLPTAVAMAAACGFFWPKILARPWQHRFSRVRDREY